MAAQVMANVGPLGIPSIAPLIRENLGLSVTQAGSFLSAYYIGPVLISLPAGWLADPVCPPVFGLVAERLGGYGAAWGTLAAGMVVALLLLIPVRERAMATS
jgi:MFS family permease